MSFFCPLGNDLRFHLMILRFHSRSSSVFHSIVHLLAFHFLSRFHRSISLSLVSCFTSSLSSSFVFLSHSFYAFFRFLILLPSFAIPYLRPATHLFLILVPYLVFIVLHPPHFLAVFPLTLLLSSSLFSSLIPRFSLFLFLLRSVTLLPFLIALLSRLFLVLLFLSYSISIQFFSFFLFIFRLFVPILFSFFSPSISTFLSRRLSFLLPFYSFWSSYATPLPPLFNFVSFL